MAIHSEASGLEMGQSRCVGDLQGTLSIDPTKVSDFPSHLPEASCQGKASLL